MHGGAVIPKYEVADGEQPAGNDLRFEVTLHLEEPKKQAAPTRASYSVGTEPQATVVRDDP